MSAKAIAVMASGHGTNLKMILDSVQAGKCPVDVQLVISDKATAPVLEIARSAGVSRVVHMDPKAYSDRVQYDAACAKLIESCGCYWVVLAGYMRILSDEFVQHFHERIVNIHPSLLPAFPGANAVEEALKHGVKVSGCTVHLVNEKLDGGPILAQATVVVRDDDTRDSLHERIQSEEHRLYPYILARLVNEGFRVNGRRVTWGNN